LIDATARPSKAYEIQRSSGIRTSYSGDLDARDPFIRELEGRFAKLLGLDPTHGETIQGQRYTAGQEFRPHTDWFVPGSVAWSLEADRGGQRSVTAMVYLNDVAEGGETDFPLLDLAIAPRRGTLLAWNNADEDGVPNPHMVHAGNPVISGTKYVITKWYRCRPWRPLSAPPAAPPQ
jgi:prolyl 4-hydroxylase